MLLKRLKLSNNSAQQFGGAIYLGEDHNTVALSEVVVKQNEAANGGGLFFSRFSIGIEISSSHVLQNTANSGGLRNGYGFNFRT